MNVEISSDIGAYFFLNKKEKGFYLCRRFNGDVSEWLKEHAWKVCIRQKRIESSNLSVSARLHVIIPTNVGIFHVWWLMNPYFMIECK